MATRLYGILTDGLNKPIVNATVALLAKGNTITVLNGSEAVFRTDGEGAYNVTVQAGHYKVIIGPQGLEPYKAGEIVIYSDSPEGSLNGYLINWAPEELTPDVIKQVQQLVASSEEYALQAGRSAAAANADATDARNSKASAAQSASDALVYKNDAKASEDAAKQAQAGAAGSANTASQAVTTIQGLKSDVEQLKTDTQTIKNSAVSETQAIKDAAVSETTALKDAAAASAAQASNSATEAGQQASNAAGSAQSASADAGRAEVAAEKAEQVVGGALLKDNNLSDVSDISSSRVNLKVDRLQQIETETWLYSSDKQSRLIIQNKDSDDKFWGLYDDQNPSGWRPLGVLQGGTGVSDIGSLRRSTFVQGVLCNDQTGPQSYNSYRSPNLSYTLKVDNSGLVSCIKSSTEEIIPFVVACGGTGSKTPSGARINLELDRVEQKSNETKILSPNKKTYVSINDGDWGCYNIDSGTIPLSVARGGTGGTTDEEARNNLKIDKFVQTESDTRILNQSKNHTFFITDADWGYFNNSNSERVPLPIISGGTGGTTTFSACRSLRALNYGHTSGTSYSLPELDTGIGFYSADTSPWPGGTGGPYTYAEIMTIAEGGGGPGSSGNWSQIGFSTITKQAPRYRQRFSNPALITEWNDFLVRDLNTTVDSNGFIKIASPIVKIKGDGTAEFNDESEGCIVTRDDVGVYTIKGCLGLNSDAAWGGSDGGFEIPIDINKQPRIWLDYSVKPDGSVTIRTYHRTHPNSPEFARNEIEGFLDGDPIDIPDGCFISVRVQMPSMD